MIVIATDGGLLERPVQRRSLCSGRVTRIELWADFSQTPVGTEIVLASCHFLARKGTAWWKAARHAGMGDGNMPGMGSSGTPESGAGAGWKITIPASNGAAFPVLYVRVDRQEQETLSLPPTIHHQRYAVDQVVNAQQPRRFGLTMRNSAWLINGREFKMEEVAEDEVVKLNTIEAWDFINEQNPNEAMEKMGMVHPMHIHGVQLQVIDRQMLAPALRAGWDSVRKGMSMKAGRIRSWSCPAKACEC